jgi:N-glycosylase/DNA lyase
MKHKLVDLYKTWSTSTTVKKEAEKLAKKSKSTPDINAEFKWAGSRIKGLRLIRQNPHECLFSFICSQNNNVARISQMVEKLCAKYGKSISIFGSVGSDRYPPGTLITTLDEVSYYKFPELKQLENATEDELKELGFGYRARYIVASVKQVRIQNIS